MAKRTTVRGTSQITGAGLHNYPPNVNVGEGSIPAGRRKHKPHKSHPHAKPPHKRPTQRINNTPKSMVDPAVQAATDLQFAPQDAEIKQEESAIPGWYDDYLRKLQGLQTQTTEQYKGLQGQAASLAEAVHGATPEGQKASEARNNIVAAIQGALLQQGGAAFTRNQEMAGVAGLQKTVRQGKVQEAKKDLARQKGAFATKYAGEKAQTDFENKIAAKEFGVTAFNAETKRIEANKPEPKTETTYDKEFAKQAAKYGFTPHEWALKGPSGRAKRIQEYDARNGNKPKTLNRIAAEEEAKQAARHGYSLPEWRKLPSQTRSALIRNIKPGKSGEDPNAKSPIARSRGSKQVAFWKNTPDTAKFIKKGVTRPELKKKILGSSKAPDDPTLTDALLDSLYDGHLSRETARKLQHRGYSAREIAKALDTPTFTEWRRQQANIHKPLPKKTRKRAKAFTNPFD